ncbi:hypothetical protein [Flavobacterium sp. MK4S-17]|jgi:hypothetical protein|uniref:hypothetical protein n=1 Tax=Flavobacterium sp. MK4S-17 TaxID=2543737 RepID=UPI0013573F69|nr:hypothetical protein [Flavobacterium sp. MK4S-17]
MKKNKRNFFPSNIISKYKAFTHVRQVIRQLKSSVPDDIFNAAAVQHEKLPIIYANIRV